MQAMSRSTFAIIFAVSLTTAIGNTALTSILPVIGREIGIPDALVASVFSLSAAVWAFSSPFWGRASDRHGRKPMMMIGLSGFIVSMFLCAIVVTVGLHHLLPWAIVLVLFLLARAIFGLVGAASSPATQAYVAERTTPEERTPKMSQLAGAWGVGTIVGPAIAPLLVLPFVGLAGPMFVFSLAAGAMLAVVWKLLPNDPGPHQPMQPLSVLLRVTRRLRPGAPPEPPREPTEKRKGLWFDPRLFPFLAYGFLIASCQGVQSQTLGFVIIDKLGIQPTAALGFTAVAMMAGAIAGLLSQWGLVVMFRMKPRDLMWSGVAVAAAANVIAAFAPDYWTVVVGFALASLGYGLARPGFTAGSSLSVRMDEQGEAAGAIAAVNGSSFIVMPVLGVWLYELWGPSPFLMNVVILLALVAYVFANPTLRNAGDGPATEEDAALATLERTGEGGPNV
jgi:MFS family permease